MSENRRLLEKSKTSSLTLRAPPDNASPAVKEIFENLTGAIKNNQDNADYNILKFQFANKSLETGLRDMDVAPNNTFTWPDGIPQNAGFQRPAGFPPFNEQPG